MRWYLSNPGFTTLVEEKYQILETVFHQHILHLEFRPEGKNRYGLEFEILSPLQYMEQITSERVLQ